MANPEHRPNYDPDETDRLFRELMQDVDFGDLIDPQSETKRELPPDLMDPQIAITSEHMLKTDETVMVLEAQGAMTPEQAERIIGTLASSWPYTHKQFNYSGRVMVFNNTEGRFEPQFITDWSLQSQGFVMMYYPTEIVADTYAKRLRMAYSFTGKFSDEDTTELQMLVMPEDSMGLIPPYDSALARAARYRRENLDTVVTIEEGLETMLRDDQALMELKFFAIDADPNIAADATRLTDALAYLNVRAGLDTSTIHFMSFGAGDMVQVGPEGEKYKRTLDFNYSAPMMLEHLLLLPEKVADGAGEGVQRHIPFIQVFAHENGIWRRLVAPLDSLLWIQSAKYAVATPPKFSNYQQNKQ